MSILAYILVSGILLRGVKSCNSTCTYRTTENGTGANCSSRGLKGVPEFYDNTTVLNLSNNNIEIITNGSFSGHSKLLKINMYDNELKQLTGSPFQGATNLEILDLSKNDIWGIGRTVFKELKWLEKLYLCSNNLKSIDDHVFTGLHSLTLLDICSNDYLTNISEKAFAGMDSLQEIRMNQLPKIDRYPDKALGQCSNLKTLIIDGHPSETFGEGFKNLSQLHTLILSEPSGNCSLDIVIDDMFVNVPQLKVLNMSHCNIKAVEMNALSPLRNLTLLDVSKNLKGLKFMRNISHGLLNTTIKIILYNGMEYAYGVGIKLEKKAFEFTRNLSLEVLSFRSNRLEYLDQGILEQFPKSLKVLDVSDNRFSVGVYLLELTTLESLEVLCVDYLNTLHIHLEELNGIGTCIAEHIDEYLTEHESTQSNVKHTEQFNADSDFKVTSLQPIQWSINASTTNECLFQQSDGMTDFTNCFIKVVSDDSSQQPVSYILDGSFFPPKLKRYHFSYSNLNFNFKYIHFTKNNTIKELIFDGNLLHSWTGHLANLDQLKTLVLSKNYCTHLSAGVFSEMKNLEILKIDSNFLGYDLKSDQDGSTFRNLQNLEHLDLSSNKITVLPDQIFAGLINLKTLILTDNDILTLDVNITRMRNLTFLELKKNFLSTLPRHVRHHLDTVSENSNVTVDLSDNQLECTCVNRDFVHWMANTKVVFISRNNYKCLDSKLRPMTMTNIAKIVERLNMECRDNTAIIIVCSVFLAVFFISIILGIVYRHRWRLRYLYYMTVGRYKLVHDHHNQHYDYDAFVSFAADDEDFVNRKMIPQLEDEFDVRLCIHHRDFDFGHLIAENIVESIRKSKKTVLVLSPAFMESYWCRFEFNMAQMEGMYKRGGNCIIYIIILESISPQNLSLELLHIMESHSYIEYPNDEQGDCIFWDKIQRVLKA